MKRNKKQILQRAKAAQDFVNNSPLKFKAAVREFADKHYISTSTVERDLRIDTSDLDKKS